MKRVVDGNFLKSVSVLAGGSALGQIAVVLAAPILTRLYTPEEFGVFGVYVAILSMVSVIATLRYELAIPLSRADAAAVNVLALSLACLVGVVAVSLLLVALFGGSVARLTNTVEYAGMLWLIPLGVLLTGLYQAFSFWAIRKQAFSRLAATKVKQGVGGATAQIALGMFALGPLGLILGQIVGQSAGFLSLLRHALVHDRALIVRVTQLRIRAVARRFRKFPRYSTLEGLTNSASVQFPLLLLAVFFLPVELGLFLLALRVLDTPLVVVGSAVGQVFFSHASAARHAGNLDEVTYSTFRSLVMFGAGPLIVVGFFAPEIFVFVFGDTWRQAGVYAQWIAPWLIVQLVFSPISCLTSVGERQLGGFKAQSVFLVTRVGALLIGAHLGSAETAIAAYSVAGVLVYLSYGAWLMSIAKVKPVKWISTLTTWVVGYFAPVWILWMVIN